MTLPSSKNIIAFQEKVLSFYKENKRDLPWRRTTDPYAILVSEVMLQQTQVDRVVSYYQEWLRQWPTIQDLANAERADVLQRWMGLGYNNRAVNLHKASQFIVERFDGGVKNALGSGMKIPGIGPYTEKAVKIFAFNENLATVDTNIRRILIHEFSPQETLSDADVHSLAEQCLPKGQSRDWHNALMDYGSLVLTSKKTGISPKTAQSTFEGSDRQYRAKILRHLLAHQRETFTIDRLQEILSFPERRRLQTILEGMIKDDLLLCENERYSLKLFLR